MNQKHLVSLPLAKKLHELGIVFESDYIWRTDHECNGHKAFKERRDWLVFNQSMKNFCYPAPHCAELLDAMPAYLQGNNSSSTLRIEKHLSKYSAYYECVGFSSFCTQDTPANALASLMIYLQEEGIFDFTK